MVSIGSLLFGQLIPRSVAAGSDACFSLLVRPVCGCGRLPLPVVLNLVAFGAKFGMVQLWTETKTLSHVEDRPLLTENQLPQHNAALFALTASILR